MKLEILIMTDIFQYFSWTWNLLSRQILKYKSTNHLDLFAKRVTYFWNKLSDQIDNCNSAENFKIRFEGLRKNGKK